MAIRKDFTIDVLRLLDNLKALAEKPRVFMGLALGYDKEELVIQIEKIRASLPRDVKDAASLTREMDRIMESANQDAMTTLDQAKRESERLVVEAKREAERILEQARLQQEQMIEESEVLKLAKAQSEELRNAAERDCQQMRRGADEYAYDQMRRLADHLGRMLSSAERAKAELEPNGGGKERLKV